MIPAIGKVRWQTRAYNSGMHYPAHFQTLAQRTLSHRSVCRTPSIRFSATWARAGMHSHVGTWAQTHFGRQEGRKGNVAYGLAFGTVALLGLGAWLDKKDAATERVEVLLEKDPKKRTIEETIELFHLLLARAESETESAKGKDVVVVFGDMGAGKSTLINFLWGCKMKKEKGEVVVDPASLIKQVAAIGTVATACTYLPKMIGELPLGKKKVTLFDMPGLSDNRGIEVALANTIVLKRIIEKALSVRFVFVAEESVLLAKKGALWREGVKLFEERFNNSIGREDSSISLIVTKNSKPITDIKALIKKYALADQSSVNLASAAQTYDPLDSNERATLLDTIDRVQAYHGFSSHISMSKDQLWQTKLLGDDIAKRVSIHLMAGEFDKAKDKILFTRSLARLGNPDLSLPFVTAEQAVHIHGQGLIDEMDKDATLKNRVADFKKFLALRKQFGEVADFKKLDKAVRKLVANTSDPRWASWQESYPTPVAAVGTLALYVAGCFFPAFWLGALAGGVTTLGCAKRQYLPNDEQRDLDMFFKGI